LSRAVVRRLRTTRLMAGLMVSWTAVLIVCRIVAAHVAPYKSTAEISAALEQAIGSHIDEVVIVEGHAGYGYGFAFYLDCEVEHVALREEGIKASMGRVMDLAHELLEQPEGRVLMVSDRVVDGFSQVMEECGVVVEPVGEWNGMHLYWSSRTSSTGGATQGADREPSRASSVEPDPSTSGAAEQSDEDS
jgi:hypothetical protein